MPPQWAMNIFHPECLFHFFPWFQDHQSNRDSHLGPGRSAPSPIKSSSTTCAFSHHGSRPEQHIQVLKRILKLTVLLSQIEMPKCQGCTHKSHSESNRQCKGVISCLVLNDIVVPIHVIRIQFESSVFGHRSEQIQTLTNSSVTGCLENNWRLKRLSKMILVKQAFYEFVCKSKPVGGNNNSSHTWHQTNERGLRLLRVLS